MCEIIIKSDIQIGDDISYGFNGDWYPDGKVVKISPSGKYLYSEGNKYVKFQFKGRFKVGEDYVDAYKEGYKMVGGTWVAAKGIHKAQNPHF